MNPKLKKSFLFVGGGILVIGGTLCLALSSLVKWQGNKWLAQQDEFPYQLTSVSINPFAGRVAVSLEGVGPAEGTLSLKEAGVNWDWMPLLKKELRIKKIFLESLQIAVVKEGETMIAAGFRPSTSTPSTTEEATSIPVLPLSLALREIDLNNVQVHYQESTSTYHVTLDKIQLASRKNLGGDWLRVFPNEEGEIEAHVNPRLTVSSKVDLAGPAVGFSGGFDVEDLRITISSTTKVDFSLASVTSTEDTKINATDETLSTPFNLTLHPFRLSFKNLDSTKPTQDSTLTLTTRLGTYDVITTTVVAQPLLAKPNAKVDFLIDAVALSPFSAYSEKFIGYRLKSGLLELQTQGTLSQGLLDFENNLVLHKLKLDRLKKDEKDETTEQLGLPLNTMLSLLRDKDKNIRLKVPIKGDINDPNVGVGDALRQLAKKASAMALRKTVETSIPLVKTVRLAGTAAKFVFKLRFDPVLFTEGQFNLDEKAKAQLDAVAQKLIEKQEVRLNLCSKLAPPDISLVGDGKEPLIDLGLKREEIIKKYLVEIYKIDPKRLLMCTPTVDKDESSQPRVEIYL